MQQAYAQMLDVKAVCEVFRCSRRTLSRLVRAGKFPKPHRFGRKNLWFAGTVAMVLDRLKQESEDNMNRRRSKR